MLTTILEVFGLALIVAGVALLSIPAALIVAGAIFIAWCEFGAGGDQ